MAKQAAEIIAFHFGCDTQDVRDSVYQPTRIKPKVYTLGDNYFCSPSGKQKPPKGFPWKPIGNYYGRTVYQATLDDMNAAENAS